MKVAGLLQKQSQAHPDTPAIIFKEQSISFSQLKDYTFCLANGLIKLGVQRGDKVAIYLANWPEYIYSYLAVWCCGATAVPLDFMLTEDELVSCISHSEAKILIARPKANISLPLLKEKCPQLKEIIVAGGREEATLSLEELLASNTNQLTPIKTDEKDYAIIFYTSGTTGRPKGVLVNYLQLAAPVEAMQYFVDNNVRDGDKALCALPFSHIGGLIYIQAMIAFGITVVLMERFMPLEFLKNIQERKIGWFWLVPSMYYAILHLKEFEIFDLSSLRWLVIFGAPSSPDVIRRFHQYCPQAILYHGWGLTETNAPTCVIPSGSQKIESVGRPAPWIEVKIFDDLDKEVPAAEVGEIVVRSWAVTDGYYKDLNLTRQALRNGWFHTGDLGRFDPEGYLYIVGRKKEMIKVAGEIVFEPEVEAAIHKHADIAEVAVVGVADKLRGEVPKAFIVLKEGASLKEEDLRYFLRQHLAHFKIPHYFEFILSLPKNRAGKIDKEKLRQGFIQV
jgi:acyl-CoA synthetase (AMP-forming)/AMP-acid ligase II